jgi:flagellar protein FlaJ
MALRPFERTAYRLFGAVARRGADKNAHLRLALERAHILLRPEVYLAAAYLTAAVAAVLTAVPVLLLLAARLAGPLVLGVMVYLAAVILPDVRTLNRSRGLNAKLPYALNYISTMASAGATPEQLFAGLAAQPLYGEVAQEAAWIVRDLRVLGMDLMGALAKGIDRSPSVKFQDFLQGAVTALSAGGDLGAYFNGKAEQYLQENRQDQRKFLDGLGVLAEAFVTVVVAAPLFLIVILSVMTTFGGNAQDNLLIGYILVFVLIPLSQAGFAWTVKVMTPEA